MNIVQKRKCLKDLQNAYSAFEQAVENIDSDEIVELLPAALIIVDEAVSRQAIAWDLHFVED